MNEALPTALGGGIDTAEPVAVGTVQLQIEGTDAAQQQQFEMPELTTSIESPHAAINYFIGRMPAIQQALDLGLPRDDLVATGLMAIWEAEQAIEQHKARGTWEAKNGDDDRVRASYVLGSIKRGLLRAARQERRHHLRVAELVAKATFEDTTGGDPTANIAIQGILMASVKNTARASLTPFEEVVLNRGLEDKTRGEIAAETGRHPDSVNQARSRAIHKLRGQLGIASAPTPNRKKYYSTYAQTNKEKRAAQQRQRRQRQKTGLLQPAV